MTKENENKVKEIYQEMLGQQIKITRNKSWYIQIKNKIYKLNNLIHYDRNLVNIPDDCDITMRNDYELRLYTKDHCILSIDTRGETTINDLTENEFIVDSIVENIKSMKEKYSGKETGEIINEISNVMKNPIRIIYHKGKVEVPITKQNINYGFEIEFCEQGHDRIDQRHLPKLQEIFDATKKVNQTKEINIGNGQKISVQTNPYKERKDVTRCYFDGSIAYEVVTRPMFLSEMEEKLTPIYDTINDIMKPNFINESAGGHITITEGQDMENKLNELTICNMIQLCRAYYKQIVLLSSSDARIRGTSFYEMNTKDESIEPLHVNKKYSLCNKRINHSGTEKEGVYGLEIRSFRSPKDAKECIENSKIIKCLWNISERISLNKGVIQICQEVIELNKKFQLETMDRKLYSKNAINKEFMTKELNENFLKLIEKEAEKEGIYDVIKKRLFPSTRETTKEYSIERVDALNMLIAGNDKDKIKSYLEEKGYNKEEINTILRKL